MSNQAQIDYDRQFEEDLAKATALSLEQQALDDYRRHKKYGTDYQTTRSANSTQQQQQQQFRSQGAAQRRHSDVHQASLSLSSSLARSSTPPAQSNNGNGNVDNDLICFASPTSKQPTSESGSTFERLIEDLQRLQSNNMQTALVSAGPVATPTPMPVHYAPAGYGGAASAPGGLGMQLVPYQPSTSQPQQRRLNNEELQRLYSMPNQLALQPVAPVQPAGFIYYPTYSAPAVPGSAAYMPPQYPSQAYGYGFALNNGGSSHVDFARPHSSPGVPAAAAVAVAPPAASQSSSHSVLHSGSTAGTFNVRRGTPPVGSCPSVGAPLPVQRAGNDLIDLKQDDYTRVSVLEAFDPLLNENSVSQK